MVCVSYNWAAGIGGTTEYRGGMTTVREFKCEVCGRVSSNPLHWFVILCGDSDLTVRRWSADAADSPGARHYCGEAHAQVYISRWFDSVCGPPRPDFNRPSPAK